MAGTNQHGQGNRNVLFTSRNGDNNFEVSIPLSVACNFQVIKTLIDDLDNDNNIIPIPELYKFENQDEFETFFRMVTEFSENVGRDINLNKYINEDKNKTVRFITLINYLDYNTLYTQFLHYIVKFIMKQ